MHVMRSEIALQLAHEVALDDAVKVAARMPKRSDSRAFRVRHQQDRVGDAMRCQCLRTVNHFRFPHSGEPILASLTGGQQESPSVLYFDPRWDSNGCFR